VRYDAIDVLKKCFSDLEWEWLSEECCFCEAVRSLKTIDDVENVSRMGDDLIFLAQSGKHPANRKPPSQPSRNARQAA
jgi:hypothetical protein